MSAVAFPLPDPSGGPLRWSVERYLMAVEAGVFGPDDRVEMLEGEITEKMGQDFPHIDGIRFLIAALRIALGPRFDVNAQLPLRTPDSVPEPDAYVLRGTARDFVGRYPEPHEVVLVAEVSNTSLARDREQKARIYAHAGFAEYWILNVADRQLETHRSPLPSGVYGESRVYREDEPAPLNGATILVADLLS